MLIEIARKNEFASLVRAKGVEEREMQSLNPRMYNLIGRDLLLQDSRDPLGGKNNLQEQKNLLEKYKVYAEGRCDVDSVIFDYAQKAIQAYKSRARFLKGHSHAMYRRMLLLINQHISEYVLVHQPIHISQT